MGRILQDIYSDISIASLVGLKGGTCAYFFYGLPRFSVDLDFDLLSHEIKAKNLVFERIKKIAEKYGTIKDPYMKRNTLFLMLSYGEADQNIKIEISTRQLIPDLRQHYELKEYRGISMLVAKQDYLFAGKLNALGSRKETAMRDVYDIHFLAGKSADINREMVEAMTGHSLKEQWKKNIEAVEKIKENQILQGLGELLDEKQKQWVKKNLKKETLLLLKNYEAVIQ